MGQDLPHAVVVISGMKSSKALSPVPEREQARGNPSVGGGQTLCGGAWAALETLGSGKMQVTADILIFFSGLFWKSGIIKQPLLSGQAQL